MNRLLMGSLIVMALISTTTFAQTSIKESLPNGWHLQDRATSGAYGISLDKAYQLVKGKKSKTVVVAVIDSGVDTLHEDLKEVLWRNPKEVPGNGIDDDKNGYVDDIYGWNFIGGKDGRNVKEDSYEGARVYHKFKKVYSGKDIDISTLPENEKEQYKMWVRAKNQIEGEGSEGGVDILI